jgi:hypothetical protein
MKVNPADIRVANSFRHRVRTVARALLIVLTSAALGGALYQTLSLALERRSNPMPGQLVDVGGFKMHIYCTGQGTPAVILDSGLGDSYMAWHTRQPEIAKFVHVCSYDRAGMGYSDRSSRPRTSRVFAEELHKLLAWRGCACALHPCRPFDGWIQCSSLCRSVSARGGRYGSGRCLSSLPTPTVSARAQCNEPKLDQARGIPRVLGADWDSSATRILRQRPGPSCHGVYI